MNDPNNTTAPLTGEKLPFQILPSEPMIVMVTTPNGKKYRTAMRVAILDVTDTGKYQPNDPTIPLLQFKAQMVVETVLVE